MTSTVLQFSRSLKTQSELYEFYGKSIPPDKPRILKIKEKCTSSAVASYILSLFPIVNVIKTYKWRKYLLDDIVSGVSAACLHFPQGLAYGMLASLSPANGLYTSFFPVLMYVIFGSSQHVSFGTNAVVAIFAAELVNIQLDKLPINPAPTTEYDNASLNLNMTTVAPEYPDEHVEYKASVAAGSSFIIGLFLLAMGLCRLGFITSYMSTSFISAFAATGAIHIISSQIPNALGIKIHSVNKPGKLIYMFIDIFKAVPIIHGATVIVTVISLLILIVVKDVINEKCKHRMKMPIPIDVILVVLATIISHFGKLRKTFHIEVVGDIPLGLPIPKVPNVSSDILVDSIVTAIIIFILAISMVRICESKHEYVVDDNQELIAYGMANLGGSFFSCFAASLSPPRTALLSAMGAKTTLNGLASALVLLLVILFIGDYLEEAPKSVLAAMIIVAVKNLVTQVKELPNLWRMNRYDFVIFLGTLLSGVLLDIPYALYLGVLLCLLTVVVQSQNSRAYSVAKVEQEDRLLDVTVHDVVCKNPKIAVFRMESSLYFATVDRFKQKLYKCTLNPKAFRKQTRDVEIIVKQNGVDIPNEIPDEKTSLSNASVDIHLPSPPLTHVIIDCSSINYIDLNGAKVLTQIVYEFDQIGITVLFGNCTSYMRNFIEISPLKDKIEKTHIYADILDAYFAAANKI